MTGIPDGLIKLKEFADLLRRPYESVRQSVKAGRLAGATKIGGTWYIDGAAFKRSLSWTGKGKEEKSIEDQ